MKPTITWNDFEKLDIRCGVIIEAHPFPEAKKPAYILKIDFGKEIGVKKSSAQITDLYTIPDLVGKKILGIINFAPKQIGSIMSECLVCGFRTQNGVILIEPPSSIDKGNILQ